MLVTTTKTLTEELALSSPRKAKVLLSARVNMERLSGSMVMIDDALLDLMDDFGFSHKDLIKTNLRQIANKKRVKDGRQPLPKQVRAVFDTVRSFDMYQYIPFRLSKDISDLVIGEAKKGNGEANLRVGYIDNKTFSNRQVHEILTDVYNELEYEFDDMINLYFDWVYSYDEQKHFMWLTISW